MMKAAEAFADTPGKLPMVKATPKKVQSQSSESKPLLALPAPPAQEPSAAPLETAPGTDKDDNESSGQQKEEAEEDLDFTDDEEIDPDPETYADLSDTEPDAEQKNTSENDQQPVVDEGNHKESDVDVIKENQNPDQSQAGDVISPINPKGTAGDMVDVDMDKENKEDKEKEDDKVDHEKKSEKDDGIDNGNHETKSVMQDHAEVSPDVKDGLNTQDCADSNGEDLESLLDRAMEEQPSQHVGSTTSIPATQVSQPTQAQSVIGSFFKANSSIQQPQETSVAETSLPGDALHSCGTGSKADKANEAKNGKPAATAKDDLKEPRGRKRAVNDSDGKAAAKAAAKAATAKAKATAKAEAKAKAKALAAKAKAEGRGRGRGRGGRGRGHAGVDP